MHPGEIFLAAFPFGDVPGMKLRPVLLLTTKLGLIPEVLVAYISSVIPAQLMPFDLILDPARPEFHTCNLKVVSALRLHKLATIHCSSLVRRLGTIDATRQAEVAARLKALLVL
jgi:hypothetical protein